MFSLIAIYFSYRRQAATEAPAFVQAPKILETETRIELPLAA